MASIVNPGVYRLSNGKWKKHQEPKVLSSEMRTIEETPSEKISTLKSPVLEIRNRLRQQQQQQQQAEYFLDC